MRHWGRWLLVAHALAWIALAVAAYTTAGPYTLASCWKVIPTYSPPAALLLAATAIGSLVVLLISILRPALRQSWGFVGAAHGMTVTVGLIASTLAADVAAGQVSCL